MIRPDILRGQDWSAFSTYREHMSALVLCALYDIRVFLLLPQGRIFQPHMDPQHR
jgi:hypothetical protein